MATVKKYQAGGVASKKKKAPMVDPKGAWTKVQERTLGNMKKGGTIKKAQSGTSAKKEYDEAYAKHKAGRQAIGKNDKKVLEDLGGGKPYNTVDLARDYSKAQKLRKKAGLGQMEAAKLSFPQMGQQLRGSVNKMMGTNYKKGGKIAKKK